MFWGRGVKTTVKRLTGGKRQQRKGKGLMARCGSRAGRWVKETHEKSGNGTSQTPKPRAKEKAQEPRTFPHLLRYFCAYNRPGLMAGDQWTFAVWMNNKKDSSEPAEESNSGYLGALTAVCDLCGSSEGMLSSHNGFPRPGGHATTSQTPFFWFSKTGIP